MGENETLGQNESSQEGVEGAEKDGERGGEELRGGGEGASEEAGEGASEGGGEGEGGKDEEGGEEGERGGGEGGNSVPVPVSGSTVNHDEDGQEKDADMNDEKPELNGEQVGEIEEGSQEEEGGERGDNKSLQSRKLDRSELLKSAGIQLQGSSESDMTGAARSELAQTGNVGQDRNLEQFSEILLDSDVSQSDSETQPEGKEEEKEEDKEGGAPKSERRVRFADEITESADTG